MEESREGSIINELFYMQEPQQQARETEQAVEDTGVSGLQVRS